MKIVHIQYPYAIIDDGQRILLDEICGVPQVGYELVVGADGEYNIRVSSNDSDCVNGVCPIR